MVIMKTDATKLNYETANDWHAEKSMQYGWSSEIDTFLSLLPSKTQKILDVGCGNGRDIQTFLSKGFAVEGLDYTHAAVEGLRKKFPNETFYEADMRKTGLASELYGGIWACASVLNLPKSEVSLALNEFKRLLVPGGILFLSVKEGEGERMVPDRGGERFFSFYKEEELSQIVQESGFKIQKINTAEGVAVPAVRWISVYANKI
ncbi:class I SAM-dependent methyltransferase [Patescibacteria group bacterium]|nr:MAG: class I SAM-dependent methyltransferase [Patescibacteria group bacterium]